METMKLYRYAKKTDPQWIRFVISVFGAEERTRTSTELPPHGPEPCASTNSATSALSERP